MKKERLTFVATRIKGKPMKVTFYTKKGREVKLDKVVKIKILDSVGFYEDSTLT